MDAPQISIIIPTFNRGPLLRETLDSVVSQTESDWECIVVDDHSTDGSFTQVQEHFKTEPRIHFVSRNEASVKGANACRNQGVAMAKGHYVLFLDSDDLLATDCLSRRLKTANAHLDYDLWIFNMSYFKERMGDDSRVVNKEETKGIGYLNMFLSYQIPWQISAPLIRRSAVVQFNEKLARFQDVEFAIQLLMALKEKLYYQPQSSPDSYYRVNLMSNPDNPDPAYLNGVNRSLYQFFLAVTPLVKGYTTDKSLLKKQLEWMFLFYKRNFKLYVLPNIKVLDASYSQLRRFLYKQGVISFGIYLKFGILERLYLKGWDKKKGTGTYTLTRKWLS